jgi:hypothetical protein
LPKQTKTIKPEDVSELVELLTNSIEITEETKDKTINLIKDLYENLMLSQLEIKVEKEKFVLHEFETFVFRFIRYENYPTPGVHTGNRRTTAEKAQYVVDAAKRECRDFGKEVPENINPKDYEEYFS